MSDKALKFSVLVDQTSLLQTQRWIQGLTSDLQKLGATMNQASQSFSGLFGGANVKSGAGSNFGKDTITAAYKGTGNAGALGAASGKFSMAEMLSSQAGAFKGLASVSKESLNIVRDVVAKTTDETKRKLEGLQQSLAKTAAQYRDLTANAAGFAAANRTGGIGGAAAYATQRTALQGQMSSLAGDITTTQKQLAGMAGPPTQQSWLMGQLSQGASAAMVGGLALAGGMAVSEMVRDQPFQFIRAESRAAQGYGAMGVAAKRGSMRDFYALQDVMNDSDKRKEFNTIADMGAWDYMGAGASAVGGMLKGNFNVPLAFEKNMENIENERKERSIQYMTLQKSTDPMKQAALDVYEGSAQGRMRMAMRMGMGMQGISNMARNTIFSDSERSAAFEATRSLFGMRGGVGAALGGMASGLDMGAAAQIAAMGQAGGSNLLGQVYGLKGGGMDTVAAQQLGMGAAASVQANPFTSGGSMLGAMGTFGFSGGAMGQMEAQARAGSAQTIGSFGTQDQYGTGVSMLSSISTLGTGANLYSMSALNTAIHDTGVVADAFRGRVNPTLAQKGITAAQVIQAFSANRKMQISNRMADFSGSSAESSFARNLINNYGGDERAMFNKEFRGKKNQNDFFNLMGGVLGNLEGDQSGGGVFKRGQAERTLLGFGHAGRIGRAGGGGSTLEAARERAMNTNNEDLFNQGQSVQSLDAIKSMKQISSTMQQIGRLDKGSRDAADSLIILKNAIDQLGAYGGDLTKALGGERVKYTKAQEKQSHDQAMAHPLKTILGM